MTVMLGSRCNQEFSGRASQARHILLPPMSSSEFVSEFQTALQYNELELYYQPIVLISTGQLKGFEALVRWHHPIRGTITPAEFIPFAEATGLIIPLTRWVLSTACQQLKIWQHQFPRNPPLTMSVNIVAAHFCLLDLVEEVQQVIQSTGVDPISLKLEITESSLITNSDAAQSTLQQLKELDIQTHLDDFGTGYSSLAYLCKFPIDTLKLDRLFVDRIDVEYERLKIVYAILDMAWGLGMNVIAEGIETEAQLNVLRSLKCDYGQGFLFSRPLPSQDAEKQWLMPCLPYCS